MFIEFLNSINQTKENLIKNDPKVEKEYVPFSINRSFSYFPETVLKVAEINFYPFLDKKLQYDYLLAAIPKKKRFPPKWIKPVQDEKIKLIQEVYGYSERKAREVADLLDEENLRSWSEKGGSKKSKQ